MKNSELMRLMTRKMGFAEHEGASHRSYTVVIQNGVIPLPITVRLCRGSGEATKTVQRSTAKDLGLSEEGLTTAVGCKLGRACVLLCHLIIVVDRVVRRHQNSPDPIVQRECTEAVMRVCDSVELILDDLNKHHKDGNKADWSKPESKALSHIVATVDDPSWHPLASGLADRFKRWAKNRHD